MPYTNHGVYRVISLNIERWNIVVNYIDLFAGAGGLSEGFSANRFNAVAHVEMNQDACFTLKTRICYYFLKRNNKQDIYRKYLKKEISRNELYSFVPKKLINSVINETMSKDNMTNIFRKIDESLRERKIKKVDLIVGGPPCQAYSLVGRAVKENNMIGDPRNYLYQLYIKVLKQYQPKMFVFENVPGLLTANNGKYFSDMKKEFIKAGYKIDYRVLNAIDFGVLQNRRRVILIGWKKNLNVKYPEFDTVKNEFKIESILSDLPFVLAGQENNTYSSDTYSDYLKKTKIRKPTDVLTWHIARPHIDRDKKIYKKAIEAWENNHQRIKYTDLPEELCTHKNRTAFLDRFKVVAADLTYCHTMMAHIAKDGHYFIHPDKKQLRSITVREAARIQSFPDDFYFEGSRTAAFTQIGNAVPPLMAYGIAKRIREILEGLS